MIFGSRSPRREPSVTLSGRAPPCASREVLAWVEGTCETLAQAAEISMSSPVTLAFPLAAQAFLGPVADWFVQGGWIQECGIFRSRTA